MGADQPWRHGAARDRRIQVRLARSADDVQAAQRLRFDIFHEEMGARLSRRAMSERLDVDPYDAHADHLLVEHEGENGLEVVGTYRLLRQTAIPAKGRFYSASEFDLSPLLDHARASGRPLLELGRSCVAPRFRDSRTIQLLWRGIADYLETHGIGTMFGCASFHGTDPAQHAAALSYLHHNLLAPPHLRATVLPGGAVDTNMLPIGSYDLTSAARALPPLVKGYLRVGAMIGEGAFIDHAFGTIDVLVVMPVDAIAARYSDRFSALRIAA
jgi:L-ornithine Nalpha-acyltransferase